MRNRNHTEYISLRLIENNHLNNTMVISLKVELINDIRRKPVNLSRFQLCILYIKSPAWRQLNLQAIARAVLVIHPIRTRESAFIYQFIAIRYKVRIEILQASPF